MGLTSASQSRNGTYGMESRATRNLMRLDVPPVWSGERGGAVDSLN